MQRNSIRPFSVQDPVFKTEPVFALGMTPERLRAYVKRNGWRVDVSDADRPCAGIMFTFDRPPWRMVWTRTVDAAVAMHETFHLVTRICYDKNIAIRARDERGEIGDETAAYMFEFFAEKVLRRLRRAA